MDDAYIYHYTRLETGLERILPNKSLRLGPLSATNDPKENCDWDFTIFGSGRKPNDLESAWQAANHSAISPLRRGLLVVCFCEDFAGTDIEPKIEGYARPRMWSQYGDNHRGLCLVFDRASLVERLKDCVASNEKLICDTVRYAGLRDRTGRHGTSNEEVGIAHTLNMDRVEKFGLEAAIIEHRDIFARELFFTKHQDWRDEWEYRCILFSNERPDFFVRIDDIILEVIVGTDFPLVYKDSLRSLCAPLGVKISQVCWRNGLRARKKEL